MPVRTCDQCGRAEDDPASLALWSTAVEHGRRKWLCVECSRRYLRAIEGRLDSEWW